MFDYIELPVTLQEEGFISNDFGLDWGRAAF